MTKIDLILFKLQSILHSTSNLIDQSNMNSQTRLSHWHHLSRQMVHHFPEYASLSQHFKILKTQNLLRIELPV